MNEDTRVPLIIYLLNKDHQKNVEKRKAMRKALEDSVTRKANAIIKKAMEK
jgi:hypothetical protein